jgi:hypothetical protein
VQPFAPRSGCTRRLDRQVAEMSQKSIFHLQHNQIVQEIKKRPGVMPIDIDQDNHKLVWFDIGDHQLTESYFFTSTKRLILKQERPILFTTEISSLASNDILTDYIYPSGFIFHMGRCGSTLLSKALARSPKHLVISEAPPHYLIWEHLKGNWLKPLEPSKENRTIYRNLILTMGRQRLSDQQAHFIKFTTYNILFIDFIHQVFPDVPSLFLYRDPAEVVVSFLRQGAGWFRLKDTELGALTTGYSVEETKAMSPLIFIVNFLIRFISAALKTSVEDLAYLNYDQLSPQNFEVILNALNYTTSPDQIALMQRQFYFFSKDDSDTTPFVSDKTDKQKEITPEIKSGVAGKLTELYNQLETSEKNLTRLLA